jgi:hypothetical protein
MGRKVGAVHIHTLNTYIHRKTYIHTCTYIHTYTHTHTYLVVSADEYLHLI